MCYIYSPFFINTSIIILKIHYKMFLNNVDDNVVIKFDDPESSP